MLTSFSMICWYIKVLFFLCLRYWNVSSMTVVPTRSSMMQSPSTRASELFRSQFLKNFQDWLKREQINATTHSVVVARTPLLLLEIDRNTTQQQTLFIHLIPSPKSLDTCLPAGLTQTLTDFGIPLHTSNSATSPPDGIVVSHDTDDNNRNAIIQAQQQIVTHLHEDVWNNVHTGPICRARLLCRFGRTTTTKSKRVFARKTTCRRIDSPTATAFLQRNHLWGATKAKYSYGLYTKGDDELVAVATFSARRRIQRNNRMHRSHELIRFCSCRDGSVVGGVTKLLSAFIRDQSPDDIVTVIDRDWGVGSTGWHSIGFETVAIMPPIVMAICATDGTRRHLVGAGISSNDSESPRRFMDATDPSTRQDRLGVPTCLFEELATIDEYSKAFLCLDRHRFYPVHDTGVERLLLLVQPNANRTFGNDVRKKGNLAAADVWRKSSPKYAEKYYSINSGINALLRHAETCAAEVKKE